MYAALWRKLPGNTLAKTLQAIALLAIAIALLFYVVFPAINHLITQPSPSVAE